MATSTIRPVNGTGTTAPPNPPGRRNRGRNKNQSTAQPPSPLLAADDIDNDETPETAEPDPDSTAAQTAAAVRDEKDFWLWLSRFTAADWSQTIVYVYRTAPQVDRRKIGQYAYLMKYSEAFDIDTIKQHHGSGGYRLDVLRITAGGGSFRIAQEYITIMDLNFPPKLVAGEWIDRPENADWQWAKPQLEKELTERKNAAAMNVAGDPTTGVTQTLLGHLDKLRPADPGNQALVVEMQRGMNDLQKTVFAAADPMKQLTLMLTLFEKLRPATPTGPDPLITMLMEDRKAMRDQITELTKLVTAQASTPRKTFREELSEMLTLSKLFNKGEAKGDTDENRWLGVAEKVLEHGSEIVSAFQGRAAQAPQQPQQPRPMTTIQRNSPPPPMQQTAPQQTAAPGSEPQASTEGEEMNQAITAEQQARYDEILANFGELIKNVAPIMIDKFRGRETGYEFRDWFIDRKGLDNYVLFVEGVRPEEVVELSQQHPLLKTALSPRENFLIFMQEFFTQPGDEPEDDDENGAN